MLLPMPEINALSRGNQCSGLAFHGLAGFEAQRSCFAAIKTYGTRFPAGVYKGPARYLTVSEAGRFRVNTPDEINSNESVDRHRRKYSVRKLKSTIVNLHAFCAPVFRADHAKPYNISAPIRYAADD